MFDGAGHPFFPVLSSNSSRWEISQVAVRLVEDLVLSE